MFEYNRIACGVLVAIFSQTSFAQNDLNQALIERGLFWQARDDNKRAAEAWNKLLEVSPDNTQALYGLATIDLRAGRIDSARNYLQRMERTSPSSPFVSQLRQDIALSSPQNKALLEEVRQAVASSDVDTAVQKYEQIFRGQQPVGTIGRDYYTLLGYTPDGMDVAINNLTQLQKQSPDDANLELALARHLARKEATRTEGIARLARLSSNSEIGNDAAESWRDALIWLSPPQPSAQPLYKEYLSKYPDDTEIRDLLEEGVAISAQASKPAPTAPPDPLRQRASVALKQIDAGNTALARAEFEAILTKRPNDSEALGGMGVLAMREGNWNQALDYLTRARRGNAAWQSSLNTARYWVSVEQAQAALDAGDLTQARRIATQATRLAPGEVAANVVLADILLEEGKTTQATNAYQAILKRKPGDSQALFGLSRATRLSGDPAQASKLLEQALLANPESPWVRYELAQAYRDEGRSQQAQQIIDELVASNPDNPDVLYISAIMASEQQNWSQTLQTLDRIPVEQRTAPMNQLYATANRQVQIREAVNLARSGDKQQAIKWLEQIRSDAGNDWPVTNAVARAYVDIGETSRGLALLKPIRSEGGTRGVDATIAYAGLLLASGQDLDASLMLRQLQDSNLTAAQREQVNTLADGYRVRQADQLTAKGELAAAYDVIAPVLKRRPDDLAAQGALARMYAASGQPDKALAIYENLLQADPDNPQIHLGLALLAQQMGNDRQAAREAEKAVELAPNNRDVLVSAASISRDSGRTGDAVALLERALALEAPKTQSGPETRGQTSGSGQTSGNPFAAQTTQGSQVAAAPSSDLARELELLYEQRSAQAIGGVEFRSRSGQSGTSQLTEVQAPMEAAFPVGNGRVNVRVTPVTLNAGNINSVPAYTGPANLLQYNPLRVNDSTQSGVGLSVGYKLRGMEFDAGVTPIGFQQTNFTGGALFSGTLDSARTVGYRLDISRRPVTDSMLSFAGRRYDDLGLEWGGVTATGARLTLSKDFGKAGLYASAAWHSLRGKNVATNQRTEFNLGAYFRVIDESDTRLMAGVNLNGTFYQKNLGYFTYGSGGYFSPQQYYTLSVPVSWAHRSGPLSFRFDGALGVQQFRQSDSPVFPNNPELQAYAEQLAGANNLFGNGYYPGQSKTGFSYNLRASAEYRLNPNLVFGATFGADNAQDYQEWAGGIYLRYYFQPQRNVLLDLPIQPYRSPYGLTYGR